MTLHFSVREVDEFASNELYSDSSWLGRGDCLRLEDVGLQSCHEMTPKLLGVPAREPVHETIYALRPRPRIVRRP
jgi:hypothetical protein